MVNHVLESFKNPALDEPRFIKELKDILIGWRADHITESYRVDQYFKICLSDRLLEPYLTLHDDRVQYGSNRWFDYPFGKVVSSTGTLDDVRVSVFGEFTGDDSAGLNRGGYKLDLNTDDTELAVKLIDLYGNTEDRYYLFTEAAATTVYLNGPTVRVVFKDGASKDNSVVKSTKSAYNQWLTDHPDSDTASYLIEFANRPERTIDQIDQSIKKSYSFNKPEWSALTGWQFKNLLNIAQNGESPARRVGAAFILVAEYNHYNEVTNG